MSHYLPRETAARQDQLAIDPIIKLAPQVLFKTVKEHNISMCGLIPCTVAITAALALGASHGQLIRYSDSAEVSLDVQEVVGYAGFVIR